MRKAIEDKAEKFKLNTPNLNLLEKISWSDSESTIQGIANWFDRSSIPKSDQKTLIKEFKDFIFKDLKINDIKKEESTILVNYILDHKLNKN